MIHTLPEVRDEQDRVIFPERGFTIESTPSIPDRILNAITLALSLEGNFFPLGVGVGATDSVVLSSEKAGLTVEVRWIRTS